MELQHVTFSVQQKEHTLEPFGHKNMVSKRVSLVHFKNLGIRNSEYQEQDSIKNI